MTDLAAVKTVLRSFRIELPSWAFGLSGTRFRVFGQPGVPRTVFEKIDDAAVVHRLTGAAPTVAVHIPWDATGDYGALAAYARDQGVAIGTVNANVFQDDAYMLGSVCHPDAGVRAKALDHLCECIGIMDAAGSRDLKLPSSCSGSCMRCIWRAASTRRRGSRSCSTKATTSSRRSPGRSGR